ncbi:hypothetical protein [Paenibacillus popilliae]|uniref:hypothetical protein n=1 Tax=Paenibacillus popilliae TaxID=78057 RepID=UPI000313017D
MKHFTKTEMSVAFLFFEWAAIIGCLIYIPQFLASVQTLEVVPPFAVGSAASMYC